MKEAGPDTGDDSTQDITPKAAHDSERAQAKSGSKEMDRGDPADWEDPLTIMTIKVEDT